MPVTVAKADQVDRAAEVETSFSLASAPPQCPRVRGARAGWEALATTSLVVQDNRLYRQAQGSLSSEGAKVNRAKQVAMAATGKAAGSTRGY